MARKLNSREAVRRIKFFSKYHPNDAMVKSLSIYRDLDDSQKNGFVINSLLTTWAKHRSFDHTQNALFMESVEEIITFQINGHCTFNASILIRCLKNHCDSDQSDDSMDSFARNLSVQSIDHLITLCAASSDVELLSLMMGFLMKRNESKKAINLYHEFNGVHDFISHGLCIIACAQTHDLETAQRLIDRIFDINQIDGYPLEFVTILISYFGEIGDVERAQSIFDTLSERDSVCIGAMMDALSRNGRYKECIVLFDEMKTTETHVISEVIYCIVLSAYSHSRQPQDALALFQRIPPEYQQNPRIITAVIDAMGRSGESEYLDSAERIYAEYAECNRAISHRFKMNMLLSILSSCRRHHDLSRGLRIFEKLEGLESDHGMDDAVRSSMYSLIGALRNEATKSQTVSHTLSPNDRIKREP